LAGESEKPKGKEEERIKRGRQCQFGAGVRTERIL